jgi:hypothetical protein
MSMIQYRLFSAAQYRESWGEPVRRAMQTRSDGSGSRVRFACRSLARSRQ